VFVGMTLAGAGVGAAGGGLIAALSGASVRKDAVETLAKPVESYIVVAEQITPEQVIQAKQILGQVNDNPS
jgi:gas vesicle protein